MELRLKPVSRLSCRRCPHGLAESLFIISFSRSDSSHTVDFRAASHSAARRSAARRSESRNPLPKMLFFAARWLSSSRIYSHSRAGMSSIISRSAILLSSALLMTCAG